MATEGDLLTDDEKLLRVERWQGETRDLPTTIRALAKVHSLASEETIDESEMWYDFVDDLATLIEQLTAQCHDTDSDTLTGDIEHQLAA
jgi:hypothetical protein